MLKPALLPRLLIRKSCCTNASSIFPSSRLFTTCWTIYSKETSKEDLSTRLHGRHDKQFSVSKHFRVRFQNSSRSRWMSRCISHVQILRRTLIVPAESVPHMITIARRTIFKWRNPNLEASSWTCSQAWAHAQRESPKVYALFSSRSRFPKFLRLQLNLVYCWQWQEQKYPTIAERDYGTKPSGLPNHRNLLCPCCQLSHLRT